MKRISLLTSVVGSMIVGAAMMYGLSVALNVNLWWIVGASFVGVLTTLAVVE